jgi:hypothetical protein
LVFSGRLTFATLLAAAKPARKSSHFGAHTFMSPLRDGDSVRQIAWAVLINQASEAPGEMTTSTLAEAGRKLIRTTAETLVGHISGA